MTKKVLFQMPAYYQFGFRFDDPNHEWPVSSNKNTMKGITTQEAFASMIQLRGIHNELGLEGSTVRTWRKLVNDHPDDPTQWKISTDRMEQLLLLTGHQVVQEKLWKG